MRSHRLLSYGAAIAAGSVAFVDNVLLHWVLGWHRLWPYPYATEAEVILAGLGVVVLVWGALGARRELRSQG